VHDLGENFVQELLKKREELSAAEIRWHFIGHLQSNKVKQIIEWVHLVHSVDSLNLGSEISKRAAIAGRRVEVLIEVNSTGEAAKFGVRPGDLPGLAEKLGRLPNLAVAGLMTVGPFLPDPESSRPSFRMMRTLRESLAGAGRPLPHLSMGMTNDFEVAIEEGATMIRIGTAIFGPRSKAGSN
jgi:pyridoxal phosphate enzyme (YggS family)